MSEHWTDHHERGHGHGGQSEAGGSRSPANAAGQAHHHSGDGRDHGRRHAEGLVGLIRSIFAPHGHDAADSVDPALEASTRGIRASQISFAALTATGVLQVVLLVATGSVALLADTIHNFADAMTGLPLWLAFTVGRRAATPRFTYGYRRAEDLAGLFVVLLIALSAVLAGWESVDRLLSPQDVSNLGLVAAAGIIGFLGNELVALYRIRVGRRIGSTALVVDGLHARTDGMTSLAVLLSAAGVWLGFPQADALVGLGITAAILFVLKDAAVQMFARLMDAVDPALTAAVERAAHQPGVQAVTSVRIRWIGHRVEAEAHVTVDPELTTLASHEIAESVRHAVCHDVQRISEVVVHVDPCAHRIDDPHQTTAHHVPAVPRRPEPRPAAVTVSSRSGGPMA